MVVLAIHHLIFVVLGLGIPVVLIEFKKLILVVGAGLVEKFFLFLGLPLAFDKLKVLISGGYLAAARKKYLLTCRKF